MKLPVLLLACSVAANAALLGALVVKPTLAPESIRGVFDRSTATTPAASAIAAAKAADERRRAAKPRESARKELWSALDSSDLETLVGRLRAAGFPPNVVRAVIDAEVEAKFAPRLKALTQNFQSTPYWRQEPGYYMGTPKLFEEINQIYRERSKVLRTLLGQDAFAWGTMDPSAAQRRQFGNLSQAKIDLVQRINDDYAEMTSQIRSAMQGVSLPEDREKLALLEREKRADLSAILGPEELADYEMRTSPLTMRLRTPLSIMDASEAEFRTIFQIQQPFSEMLYPTGGVYNSEMMEKRRDAAKTINEQIKAALGEARYAQYERASNNEFQQLYRLAQRENVSYDTAARAFDLRAPTAVESMRIYNDRAMSPDDKRAALKTLAQTARTQVLSTLGQTVGPAYVDAARWITYIEQGGAVSITPEGGISYRRLPTSSPTTRKN